MSIQKKDIIRQELFETMEVFAREAVASTDYLFLMEGVVTAVDTFSNIYTYRIGNEEHTAVSLTGEDYQVGEKVYILHSNNRDVKKMIVSNTNKHSSNKLAEIVKSGGNQDLEEIYQAIFELQQEVENMEYQQVFFAYATSSTGANMTQTPNANSTYMGTAIGVSRPTSPSSYTWVQIRGGDGIGVSEMNLFYKLSASPSTAPTSWESSPQSPTSALPYLWHYAEYKMTDGSTKTTTPIVMATLGMQGPQGIQGIPGENGSDGTTYYTWIRYADTPTSGMSASPTNKPYMGIAYNKTSATPSSNYSDYTWSLTKGDTGVAGPEGTTYYTWIKYSPVESPTPPQMQDDPSGMSYIGLAFNKTSATESSNPSDYSWKKFVGEDGTDGVGLSDIIEQFQVNNSSTTAPTTWLTVPPTVSSTNRYLWAREIFVYTNGVEVEGTPRIISIAATDAKVIKVVASAQLFKVSSDGATILPQSITVTGSAQGTTISTWEYSTDGGATFSTTVPTGVSRTNNVVTVTGASILVDSIVVRAKDSSTSDTVTINKVKDGSTAVSMILSNESHTLAANTSGTVSSFVGAETEILVLEGSVDKTSSWTLSAVPSSGITGSLSGKKYTVTAMSADSAYVDLIATKSGQSISKRFTLSKARTGATGSTGATGKGVSSAAVTYQLGDSGTTAPTGTWLTAVPSPVSGKYLWTRTIFTYSDNTTSTPVYAVAYQGMNGINGTNGADGKDGADGRGISSAVINYATSSSGTTAPTTGWGSTIPTVALGQYLWTRTVYTLTDGSSQTQYSVAYQGTNGVAGASVTSVINYYLASASSSGVTTSTSGWTTTIQTINADKPYLWNYEVAKNSAGATVSTTAPIIIGHFGRDGQNGAAGQKGADGISITGIVEYYQVSTSNTTAPTTWITTMPTMTSTNRYLWNYEEITYSDGSKDTTLKKVIGVYGDRGPQGPQGPQGIQGIQGPAGANGQATYTWVKYADSPTSGISDYPDGKKYLGIAYNKTTPTESTNYSDYTWSLIQGPQGAQGVQGPAGANGQTTYTWIKYAPNGSPTSAQISDSPTNMTHIGIAVNKTTATESTNPSDYTWALIQGPRGPQGVQGIQGPAGANGATYYTWVKYADTPTTGMSDYPDGKKYLGIAYNKTTATESTTYSDYTWSLIQGPQGQQGPAGNNGQTTYTWIKYAPNGNPTSAQMSDSPTGMTHIGIAVNKTTATESTTPSDYTWALIKGETGAQGPQGNTGPQGPAGAAAKLVTVTASGQVFKVSSSNAVTPATLTVTGTTQNTSITTWSYSVNGGAFSTTLPAGVTRTNNVVTLTGASVTADSITVKASNGANEDVITIVKVKDGANGSAGAAGADAYTIVLSNESHVFPGEVSTASAGNTSFVVTAYKGATQQSATIGTINNLPTGMTAAITNNNTKTATVTITVTTALVTKNGVVVVPITVDGKTFTKYFSWSVAYKGAAGATGSTGATGTSITGLVEQYYLSTSKTAQTGGSWVTTQPAWAPNKYLWLRSEVKYSSGTTTYTAPFLDTTWQMVDNLTIGARNLIRQSTLDNFSLSTKQMDLSGWVISIIPQGKMLELGLIKGEQYTFSYDYEFLKAEAPQATNDHKIGFYIYNNGDTSSINIALHTNINTAATGDKGTHSYTFTVPLDKEVNENTRLVAYTQRFADANNQNPKHSEVRFTNIQLEKGNKRTDFSPALEDIENKLEIADNVAHEANDKVNSLDFGGRNLLLDSKVPYANTTYLTATYDLAEAPQLNGVYTITLKGRLGTNKVAWRIYNSGSAVPLVNLEPISGGLYGATFNWVDTIGTTQASNTAVNVYSSPESVTGSVSEIEWIKLEKGTVRTDWTPAPEDANNLVNSEVNKLNSKVEANHNGVTASLSSLTEQTSGMVNLLQTLSTELSVAASGLSALMEKTNTLENGLKSTIATEFDLLSTGLSLSVSDLQEAVNDSRVTLDGVNAFLTFTTEGLTIGRDGSPMRIVINDTEIAFMQGEQKIAHINGSTLHIDQSTILTSITMANHIIEKSGARTVFRRINN